MVTSKENNVNFLTIHFYDKVKVEFVVRLTGNKNTHIKINERREGEIASDKGASPQ